MARTRTADVVIVGGRLAGFAAVTALARAGHDPDWKFSRVVPDTARTDERRMKVHRSVIYLVTVIVLSLPLCVWAAEVWEIDPAHTSVQFAVRHLMISTVRGAFGKVSGTARIDTQDITKSSVEATIDAASINTNNEKRDAHLRNADFLDVEKHPTITFTSKRVERVSDTH